jgi:protein-S-isoprenylcysteine O-methyltransferase Ste14
MIPSLNNPMIWHWVSKVVVLTFLLFVCFRQVFVPRPEFGQFQEHEVKDSHVFIYQWIIDNATWVANLFCVMGMVAYIWPENIAVLPLLGYRSGLYTRDNRQIQPWTFVEVACVFGVITGWYLRTWAFDQLGRYFTYIVTIKDGHQLIKDGPYTYLIHPSYTGFLLVNHCLNYFVGIRGFPSWFLLALSLNAIHRRIYNEEDALRGEFGAEFEAYAAQRYRLIPFIY